MKLVKPILLGLLFLMVGCYSTSLNFFRRPVPKIKISGTKFKQTKFCLENGIYIRCNPFPLGDPFILQGQRLLFNLREINEETLKELSKNLIGGYFVDDKIVSNAIDPIDISWIGYSYGGVSKEVEEELQRSFKIEISLRDLISNLVKSKQIL